METMPKQRIFETSSITPWSRKLYRNADEFWRNSEDLHHAYIIYRTLNGYYKGIFEPDAVFYVGKSPAAYLKTVKANDISEDDVRRWHRFLWNQAVVPMLIIKSLTRIRVYTAYTKPEEQSSSNRIASILDATADSLELDQLLTAIEAGTIFEDKPELFQRSQSVDRYLLRSLNATANRLAETQKGNVNKKNLKFVHQFLTRLLFVCYLIERGMIKGANFDDEELKKLHPATNGTEGYFIRHLFRELNTYPKKRDALCRIFSRVKQRFNGSLFPEGITKEKNRYSDDFIETLEFFLNGHDPQNKQFMLDFWAYDFRVIPIETISAVYESFLGAQGKFEELHGGDDSQRTTGVYYTPLHLVELTVDIALENIKDRIQKPIHKLKALDPACGSGVFLVSLFGRMAESLYRAKKYVGQNPHISWARDLIALLHQLYGIDTNPTACHITCFSLYLALLEKLEPRDVEYLHKHGEELPRLLANNSNGYKTIYPENFFDPHLSLNERDFDIVIGNPPWVSRHNQKDQKFLNWQNKNPIVLGPDRQIAHGFMWKASEYLSDSGFACLLLPTAVLLNKNTNKFQEQWLKSVTVERVINFSDLRHILFSGAAHPCVAIRFQASKSDYEDELIYETPKTDIRSQKGGPVYIREEDTTNLRLKDILNAAIKGTAPAIWKSHFWGTWRDQRLLSRLSDLPKLSDYTGTPKKPKRFIKGQGFQPFNPKPTSDIDKIKRKKMPEKPWWSSKTRFISAKNMSDLVVSKDICEPVENKFRLLLFPRDPKLFKGPKVLVSQGSRDMKVAFCGFDVIFQSSLQTITGNDNDSDANLLRFLNVVIKSDTIQYYLFHKSTSWGTERDKSLFYELLSLPFFLPEDAPDPKRAQEIVDEAAKEIKKFENSLKNEKWFGEKQKRKGEARRIRKELEPLVREYYDIDEYEAMLIDDTHDLARKSFHPKQNDSTIPTLGIVNEKKAKVYTRTLCEMLANFGKSSSFKVNGEVIKGLPYSIVRVSLTEKAVKTVPVKNSPEELTTIFKRMESLLQQKQGRFVFCQNLKVFDGNDLYILKPMQMRFWSRTAALNDADEIAGAILDSRGEKSKWQ